MTKIASEYVEIAIGDATRMLAWVARPEDSESLRGLILFQEAFGVNSHIRNVTNRFARLGFTAIAPELFHRTAPPKFTGAYDNFAAVMPHLQAIKEDSLSLDVQATYDWLRANSKVADNIASVGYCMGGRTSFFANTVVPLKAAVSYYGGNIPLFLGRVDKASGPLLLLWGDLDKHILVDHRHLVVDTLRTAKKVFADVVFSNADHGFFCDERPSYQPKAAAISWDLTRSFLNAHMA